MFRLYYGRGITLVSLCSVYLCWLLASVVGPSTRKQEYSALRLRSSADCRYNHIDQRIDMLRQSSSPGVITPYSSIRASYSISSYCCMQKALGKRRHYNINILTGHLILFIPFCVTRHSIIYCFLSSGKTVG